MDCHGCGGGENRKPTRMNMSIRNRLTEALVKGCLVQIHRNPKDWGEFQVGYVETVDRECVRIRSVSVRGNVLGFH